MLVPGLNYAFETFLECLSDKGVSDNIKVKCYHLYFPPKFPLTCGFQCITTHQTIGFFVLFMFNLNHIINSGFSTLVFWVVNQDENEPF